MAKASQKKVTKKVIKNNKRRTKTVRRKRK